MFIFALQCISSEMRVFKKNRLNPYFAYFQIGQRRAEREDGGVGFGPYVGLRVRRPAQGPDMWSRAEQGRGGEDINELHEWTIKNELCVK